jgi:hypothetical protein
MPDDRLTHPACGDTHSDEGSPSSSTPTPSATDQRFAAAQGGYALNRQRVGLPGKSPSVSAMTVTGRTA